MKERASEGEKFVVPWLASCLRKIKVSEREKEREKDKERKRESKGEKVVVPWPGFLGAPGDAPPRFCFLPSARPGPIWI